MVQMGITASELCYIHWMMVIKNTNFMNIYQSAHWRTFFKANIHVKLYGDEQRDSDVIVNPLSQMTSHTTFLVY